MRLLEFGKYTPTEGDAVLLPAPSRLQKGLAMKKNMKKKVVSHLKSDVKTLKHEAKEDKKLMKSIRDAHKEKHHAHKKHESKKHEKHESKKHEKHEHKKDHKPKAKAEKKISKVMREFKKDELHSGSKKGPKVTNPKQAIAIAYSEARRAKKKKK